MTRAGIILGTAVYMSPEQARGRAVDARTDIWAFGCVLFEMITGRRPFDGETVTDILGAIVHKEPEWSLCPARFPIPSAACWSVAWQRIQSNGSAISLTWAWRFRICSRARRRRSISRHRDGVAATRADDRAGSHGVGDRGRPVNRQCGARVDASVIEQSRGAVPPVDAPC